MPRLYKKAELFSDLKEVGYMREATATHGDTTLTAAAAAGATSLTVAAIANFADGDYFLIGTNEGMEIAQVSGTPAGSTINLRSPLALAHANGEVVKEVTRTKLGDVTDDGVDCSPGEGDFNMIPAATKRGPVGYLMGHIAQLVEFGIEHLNLDNLAAALGIPETNITGSGTAAAPHSLNVLPDSFSTAIDAAWYFTGVRKDGMNVEIQLWGVEVDPTGLGALKFARGQVTPVRFRLRPTAGMRALLWT
jgi:hypothetical protein